MRNRGDKVQETISLDIHNEKLISHAVKGTGPG